MDISVSDLTTDFLFDTIFVDVTLLQLVRHLCLILKRVCDNI